MQKLIFLIKKNKLLSNKTNKLNNIKKRKLLSTNALSFCSFSSIFNYSGSLDNSFTIENCQQLKQSQPKERQSSNLLLFHMRNASFALLHCINSSLSSSHIGSFASVSSVPRLPSRSERRSEKPRSEEPRREAKGNERAKDAKQPSELQIKNLQKKNFFIKSTNRSIDNFNLFWNCAFDKGRLKSFVLWFLNTYGEYKTIELLEQLKNLGFGYATKAGVSLGIDDLKIPSQKFDLINQAESNLFKGIEKYKKGQITGVERLQQLIDVWNQTSEFLKQEVIRNFETTDLFNPVYMMAFSGARGNISQVRQLVGMRGLMSDPQGNIIDFPIQSNFREGLTLTEYIISTYGARKGIVDTALRTATAGYLTRRLVDVAQHVMISQFDCGTTRGIFLFDMKEGGKTIYSFQNRLIGRVLANDIDCSKSFISSQPSSVLSLPFTSRMRSEGSGSFASASVSSVSRSEKPRSEGIGSAEAEETERTHSKGNNKESYITKAYRNQEISSELAASIAKITKKAFVRSPLTCETRKLVCQLCYGWSLASSKLVSLGEAVGVIAAQSIGEPGTQLTMRTFHTGGVFSGGLTNQIIAPYNGYVEYSDTIPGTCIRTPQGDISFLTKAQGSFFIKEKEFLLEKNENKLFRSEFYTIPAYAILFARNKQQIFKKQIVAQFSSIGQQKTQRGNAEQTVYAELEGEISFSQIDLLEQQNEKLFEDVVLKAIDWAKIWILSGKMYYDPLGLNSFGINGDFFNRNTTFQKIYWHNLNSCFLDIYLKKQKNKNFILSASSKRSEGIKRFSFLHKNWQTTSNKKYKKFEQKENILNINIDNFHLNREKAIFFKKIPKNFYIKGFKNKLVLFLNQKFLYYFYINFKKHNIVSHSFASNLSLASLPHCNISLPSSSLLSSAYRSQSEADSKSQREEAELISKKKGSEQKAAKSKEVQQKKNNKKIKKTTKKLSYFFLMNTSFDIIKFLNKKTLLNNEVQQNLKIFSKSNIIFSKFYNNKNARFYKIDDSLALRSRSESFLRSRSEGFGFFGFGFFGKADKQRAEAFTSRKQRANAFARFSLLGFAEEGANAKAPSSFARFSLLGFAEEGADAKAPSSAKPRSEKQKKPRSEQRVKEETKAKPKQLKRIKQKMNLLYAKMIKNHYLKNFKNIKFNMINSYNNKENNKNSLKLVGINKIHNIKKIEHDFQQKATFSIYEKNKQKNKKIAKKILLALRSHSEGSSVSLASVSSFARFSLREGAEEKAPSSFASRNRSESEEPMLRSEAEEAEVKPKYNKKQKTTNMFTLKALLKNKTNSLYYYPFRTFIRFFLFKKINRIHFLSYYMKKALKSSVTKKKKKLKSLISDVNITKQTNIKKLMNPFMLKNSIPNFLKKKTIKKRIFSTIPEVEDSLYEIYNFKKVKKTEIKNYSIISQSFISKLKKKKQNTTLRFGFFTEAEKCRADAFALQKKQSDIKNNSYYKIPKVQQFFHQLKMEDSKKPLLKKSKIPNAKNINNRIINGFYKRKPILTLPVNKISFKKFGYIFSINQSYPYSLKSKIKSDFILSYFPLTNSYNTPISSSTINDPGKNFQKLSLGNTLNLSPFSNIGFRWFPLDSQTISNGIYIWSRNFLINERTIEKNIKTYNKIYKENPDFYISNYYFFQKKRWIHLNGLFKKYNKKEILNFNKYINTLSQNMKNKNFTYINNYSFSQSKMGALLLLHLAWPSSALVSSASLLSSASAEPMPSLSSAKPRSEGFLHFGSSAKPRSERAFASAPSRSEKRAKEETEAEERSEKQNRRELRGTRKEEAKAKKIEFKNNKRIYFESIEKTKQILQTKNKLMSSFFSKNNKKNEIMCFNEKKLNNQLQIYEKYRKKSYNLKFRYDLTLNQRLRIFVTKKYVKKLFYFNQSTFKEIEDVLKIKTPFFNYITKFSKFSVYKKDFYYIPQENSRFNVFNLPVFTNTSKQGVHLFTCSKNKFGSQLSFKFYFSNRQGLKKWLPSEVSGLTRIYTQIPDNNLKAKLTNKNFENIQEKEFLISCLYKNNLKNNILIPKKFNKKTIYPQNNKKHKNFISSIKIKKASYNMDLNIRHKMSSNIFKKFLKKQKNKKFQKNSNLKNIKCSNLYKYYDFNQNLSNKKIEEKPFIAQLKNQSFFFSCIPFISYKQSKIDSKQKPLLLPLQPHSRRLPSLASVRFSPRLPSSASVSRSEERSQRNKSSDLASLSAEAKAFKIKKKPFISTSQVERIKKPGWVYFLIDYHNKNLINTSQYIHLSSLPALTLVSSFARFSLLGFLRFGGAFASAPPKRAKEEGADAKASPSKGDCSVLKNDFLKSNEKLKIKNFLSFKTLHQTFVNEGKKVIHDICFEQNKIYIENVTLSPQSSLCSLSFILSQDEAAEPMPSPRLHRSKRSEKQARSESEELRSKRKSKNKKINVSKLYTNKNCRFFDGFVSTMLFNDKNENIPIHQINQNNLALLLRPVQHKIFPNPQLFKKQISNNQKNSYNNYSILFYKDYHSNLLNLQNCPKKSLSKFPSVDFQIRQVSQNINLYSLNHSRYKTIKERSYNKKDINNKKKLKNNMKNEKSFITLYNKTPVKLKKQSYDKKVSFYMKKYSMYNKPYYFSNIYYSAYKIHSFSLELKNTKPLGLDFGFNIPTIILKPSYSNVIKQQNLNFVRSIFNSSTSPSSSLWLPQAKSAQPRALVSSFARFGSSASAEPMPSLLGFAEESEAQASVSSASVSSVSRSEEPRSEEPRSERAFASRAKEERSKRAEAKEPKRAKAKLKKLKQGKRSGSAQEEGSEKKEKNLSQMFYYLMKKNMLRKLWISKTVKRFSVDTYNNWFNENKVSSINLKTNLNSFFAFFYLYPFPFIEWSLTKKDDYLANNLLSSNKKFQNTKNCLFPNSYNKNIFNNNIKFQNLKNSILNYKQSGIINKNASAWPKNMQPFSIAFPLIKNSFLLYKAYNKILANQVYATTNLLSPFEGELLTQNNNNKWWNQSAETDLTHKKLNIKHYIFLTKKDMFSISLDLNSSLRFFGEAEKRKSLRFASFTSAPSSASVSSEKPSLRESEEPMPSLSRSEGFSEERSEKQRKPMPSLSRSEGFSEERSEKQRKPSERSDAKMTKYIQQDKNIDINEYLSLFSTLYSNYKDLFNKNIKQQTQKKLFDKLKSSTLNTLNVHLNTYLNTHKKKKYNILNFVTKYQNKIYKLKGLSIGKVSENKVLNLHLGKFLLKGDNISYAERDQKIDQTGQIIHLSSKKITLRHAQPFLISPKGILHVQQGDYVYRNAPIITLPFETLTTGDIVQGIPKVEQYLEARTTQNGRFFLYSLPVLQKGIFERYRAKLPLEQAVAQSFLKIQQIIVDGVQRVYRSQGVSIAEKHLEVIVKQMTSKVQIIHGGQTGFFPGELVDLEIVESVNKFLMVKIRYEPIVLGITRASLEVESFLSAASFQQTTKILAKASLSKKKDYLKGLKENLLVGNLIPAGTGFMNSY